MKNNRYEYCLKFYGTREELAKADLKCHEYARDFIDCAYTGDPDIGILRVRCTNDDFERLYGFYEGYQLGQDAKPVSLKNPEEKQGPIFLTPVSEVCGCGAKASRFEIDDRGIERRSSSLCETCADQMEIDQAYYV